MSFFEGLKGLRFKHQRLMTVTELARVLNVSPSWIYQRTRLGQSAIPHLKMGKYVRFKLEEVLAFLRK